MRIRYESILLFFILTIVFINTSMAQEGALPDSNVHNINKSTSYTTIQAAINDAGPNDEIHVDGGNYPENVNVTKKLTLRGIGMPVVNAGEVEVRSRFLQMELPLKDLMRPRLAIGQGKQG